jgi:FAD/FMN-containing dehydrogenase
MQFRLTPTQEKKIMETTQIIEGLKAALGATQVLTDEASRSFYSTDLSFQPGAVAMAVVAPKDADSLAAAVRLCAAQGVALVPRGGGMSYTRGYVPVTERSVLVDMRSMNRIIEINEQDMYVRVECGCTWSELYEALKAKGLRTPYYGPLSGMYATVGGALSQNSLFHGSGTHHTAAESCLGLKVVLADGRIVQTGSAAHAHSNGFYRHFGPDLTGLFTADTGAMAIKAEATLRLIRFPQVCLCASYGFEKLEDMLAAQTEIAREGVASECYGFDPFYNAGFEEMGFSMKESLSMLADVAKSGGNILSGVKNAIKMAAQGKKVLSKVNYSLHIALDAPTQAAAESMLMIIEEICVRKGAPIGNAIPLAFRAQPFGGVRTILLGSAGEVWIPVHGFFPLSRAVDAALTTERFFAENRALMEKHNIQCSYLTCFSGAEFVIEPSLYWFDALGEFRLQLIEPEYREKWGSIPADPTTREVALKLREGLRELFFKLGACHLQLGKYYPYQRAMEGSGMQGLLRDVKKTLDPKGLMNPGSLGLE